MKEYKKHIDTEPEVLENIDDRIKLWRIFDKVLLVIIWVLALYFLAMLPQTIPTKFSGDGQIIAWESKWTLLLLPAFALLFSFIFPLAKKYPKIINTTVKITEQNREIQLKLALRFLAFMSIAIELMFGFLLFQMAYTALGYTMNGLIALLIVFGPLGLLFASLAVYLAQSIRYK